MFRTPDEVRSFVQTREKYMMQRKEYYLERFGMKEPGAPPPLAQWMNVCSHDTYSHNNNNAQSHENIAKALHEVLKR